nr:MAG: hypothetical protein [Microvirus sp.]
MINLEEVSRFVRCPEGQGLELPGERRRVRLEVNTSAPCQIMLQTGPDDMRFLVNVNGRETVQFIAPGPVTLWPDCDGEVWWWTSEMETTATVIEEPEIFTKIAERKPRNPELERIAAKMQENADRRMAQLMGQVGNVVAELRQENESLKKAKKGKSDGNAAATDNGDAGKAAADDAGAGRASKAAEGDDGARSDASAN